MTPQEKGDELIDKYKDLIWCNTVYSGKKRQIVIAISVVEEILNEQVMSDYLI